MALIPREKLDRIRKIIALRHAQFIRAVLGDRALSSAERRLLAQQEKPKRQRDVIEDAYQAGRADAMVEGINDDTTWQTVKQSIAREDVPPLSDVELLAVDNARSRAGEFIRGLGTKAMQTTTNVVLEAAEEERRAQLLRQEIRPIVAGGVARRESIARVKSTLRARIGELERDWDRVARTEIMGAHQRGAADAIARESGAAARVAKVPEPSACAHCVRLLLKDGKPRIFTLAELEANGTNFGRKAKDWLPTVWPIHPNCECKMTEVPPGMSFDDQWDLVFDEPESLGKSTRYVFAGMEIEIENPQGSIRRWRDQKGREGQTVMPADYGFIAGTRGADGEEYDCFVGPDRDAPWVYIVAINRADSGQYDEDKAFIGFSSLAQVLETFTRSYDDPRLFGGVTMVELDTFRRRIYSVTDIYKTLSGEASAATAWQAGYANVRNGGAMFDFNLPPISRHGRVSPGVQIYRESYTLGRPAAREDAARAQPPPGLASPLSLVDQQHRDEVYRWRPPRFIPSPETRDVGEPVLQIADSRSEEAVRNYQHWLRHYRAQRAAWYSTGWDLLQDPEDTEAAGERPGPTEPTG